MDVCLGHAVKLTASSAVASNAVAVSFSTFSFSAAV